LGGLNITITRKTGCVDHFEPLRGWAELHDGFALYICALHEQWNQKTNTRFSCSSWSAMYLVSNMKRRMRLSQVINCGVFCLSLVQSTRLAKH